MTEDQVAKWQKRRDEAKKIQDPAAREAALDIVYDMKDDMQLDCQRKMADRIKDLVSSDKVQAESIRSLKTDVDEIKKDLPSIKETDKDYRNQKERAKGAAYALKALDWLLKSAGIGGIGAVIWQVLRNGAAQ